MDLLLLAGIEIAYLQGIARLGHLIKWSCVCSLWRRGRHYILHVGRALRCADAVASCVQTSVCALERRCFYSWRVTLAFLLKIVGLVHAWFEATLIKAEIIVLFSSINFCRLWNATSYLVWISFRIECLIMWSLKVVINQSTLLLLPKTEIVAFQLCNKVKVLLLLRLLVILLLADELSLCFRRISFIRVRSNCYVWTHHLGTDISTGGSGATLFRLPVYFWGINRFRLFHPSVLLSVSKAKLNLCHSSFNFLSIFLCI